MTEFFTEYGLFLAKAITVVIAALIIIGTTAALSMRSQDKPKEQLKVKGLTKNDKVILMCRSGSRSAKAVNLLHQLMGQMLKQFS